MKEYLVVLEDVNLTQQAHVMPESEIGEFIDREKYNGFELYAVFDFDGDAEPWEPIPTHLCHICGRPMRGNSPYCGGDRCKYPYRFDKQPMWVEKLHDKVRWAISGMQYGGDYAKDMRNWLDTNYPNWQTLP